MRLLYKILAITGFSLLMLLALLEKGTFLSKEEVAWDAENELTWEQFKGFKKPLSFYDAAIHSLFKYEISNPDIDTIVIQAIMYPHLSWVKTREDYLLRHEQYHFNISEIIARKFRMEIVERTAELLTEEFLTASESLFLQELQYLQNKYDRETNHSTILEKQKDWEYIIDSLLNAYSYYAEPVIVKRKQDSKNQYFRKIYTDAFNQLQGKHAIEASQVGIGPHYRFFYSDDKPVRIEFWNRNQLAVDDYFNASIIEISYNNDLEDWRFFNPDGTKANNSKGYHLHRIKRSGKQMIKSFLDIHEKPCADSYGIAASVWELDENGRRFIGRFADLKGNLIKSNDGFTLLKYAYDYKDNIVEMANYDNNGQLAPFFDNIAIVKYQYDEMQNETEIQYFNSNGALQNNRLGYAIVNYHYDLGGNIIRQSFHKVDGSLWLDDFKIAISYFTYDKNSNLIDSRRYGTNKNLVFTPDGLGRVRNKYDESGNLVLMSNYDAYDELKNDNKGVCQFRYAYNENGQILSEDQYSIDSLGVTVYFKTIRYEYGPGYIALMEFGEDGLPGASIDDIWMEKRFFDDAGNLLRIENFNKDKILQPDANGVAVYTYKYDSHNNKTETAYFDQYNKATSIESGIARETYVYNPNNQIIEQRFFDDKGLPAKGGDGVEVIKMDYDSRGNLIAETYYTASGQLMEDSFGVAYFLQKYDERNNMVEVLFFNKNKRLVDDGNFGIAIQRKAYSDDNKLIANGYFDCNNNLLNLGEGYAMVSYEYDSRDNITSQSFFSANKEPVAIKAGYSTVQFGYDNNNNQILESYFDVDGNFVENDNGHALLNWVHNRNGDVVNTMVYNAKDAPLAQIDYGPFMENANWMHHNINSHLSSSVAGSQNERRIVTYHKNGNKESEVIYIDGKPNGKSITWYDTGEIESVTNYINGKLHGSRTEYYKDGRIKNVIEYRNNIIYSSTFDESED